MVVNIKDINNVFINSNLLFHFSEYITGYRAQMFGVVQTFLYLCP
ncbi:hypothetical protein M141_2411 [Bacteroides fragilis str. S38L5]|uniref:Uncharacterized protein n=2 Tax=Bacteroides fragilis TaxID=817 RepID=A0A015U0T2_BACFG|nr:hypothetical protein M118_2338 [Bacteroides fragilis str. 3783N1-2]EXY59962.1 hypothetical protein M111_2503 [Bacteroides fragilis str. 3986T(B)10]EXY90279.1 hypothetical protein M125_3048 [Bacteroides fragilis str. 3998T(B)3]EXY95180.1 hypothetical protein M081_2695 [Bacteroides fragilis str. 3998 T(B) 4]EXZ05273.1 hypothetical protein M072_2304 [Bacteroides fragilis str. DS-208]EXZ18999.1 hypothetical protein M067_2568 [Bacteroides fragilis str. J-143-4]EXZ72940.1 hypothetical protein M1